MNADIKQAAHHIVAGELVIFPTETVYGIGADATNPSAIKKIYAAKNRPSNNPLIVHISDQNQLLSIADSVNPIEQRLIDAFWPGPLTLVFKRKASFPSAVCAGGDTIAVRCPDDAITRALIDAAQTPIAAPSANISTRPSPTRIEDLDPQLVAQVQYVLNGEPCAYGLESTVIKVEHDSILLLRPGAITRQQIENSVQRPVINPQTACATNSTLLSPGTSHKHYSPQTPLKLIEDNQYTSGVMSALQKYKKIAILATAETLNTLKKEPWFDSRCQTIVLGHESDLQSVAANLFHNLHNLDKLDVEIGLIQSFPYEGIGEGIMDRIRRAAAQ